MFFKNILRRRKEDKALVRIVDSMKAEQDLMIEYLAQQLEQKLAAMTPEERQRTLQSLQRKLH